MSAIRHSLEIVIFTTWCFVVCGFLENFLRSTFPSYLEVIIVFSGFLYLIAYSTLLTLGSVTDAGSLFAISFFTGENHTIAIFRIFILSALSGAVLCYFLGPDSIFVAAPHLGYSMTTAFLIEMIANIVVGYVASTFKALNPKGRRRFDSLISVLMVVQMVMIVSRPYTIGGVHLTSAYTAGGAGVLFIKNWYFKGMSFDAAVQSLSPFVNLIVANFVANMIVMILSGGTDSKQCVCSTSETPCIASSKASEDEKLIPELKQNEAVAQSASTSLKSEGEQLKTSSPTVIEKAKKAPNSLKRRK
eukprot:GDKJ01032889.1.p1 GENE.GDKJ01032889.1~~GDKJ01032889.1.p1  ORF type:complete len:303 (-),score=75.67 GDKJ01032889.1:87-995(-)